MRRRTSRRGARRVRDLKRCSRAESEGRIVESIEYGGWKNCIRLENGKIEVVATTDVGPRVIRCGFVGGENILGEFESDLGQTDGETWRAYGGHRLWHSPEQIPRTYQRDNGPVAHAWDGTTLRLTQPIEHATGIEKHIEITLDPAEARVRLLHRLTN